jgi:hypothetical protein
VIDTCFENKNKDLLGSRKQETLDLKSIRVVNDYLKQQATMKCKCRNEKECTHIYNIRKNLAFQICTHSIESKSQCLEFTTLEKNSIIEDDGHSFINHHATRCACYRMPLMKGKVVEQASL